MPTLATDPFSATVGQRRGSAKPAASLRGGPGAQELMELLMRDIDAGQLERSISELQLAGGMTTTSPYAVGIAGHLSAHLGRHARDHVAGRVGPFLDAMALRRTTCHTVLEHDLELHLWPDGRRYAAPLGGPLTFACGWGGDSEDVRRVRADGWVRPGEGLERCGACSPFAEEYPECTEHPDGTTGPISDVLEEFEVAVHAVGVGLLASGLSGRTLPADLPVNARVAAVARLVEVVSDVATRAGDRPLARLLGFTRYNIAVKGLWAMFDPLAGMLPGNVAEDELLSQYVDAQDWRQLGGLWWREVLDGQHWCPDEWADLAAACVGESLVRRIPTLRE